MLTSQHRFTTYQSMRTDLLGSRKDISIVFCRLLKFVQQSLNVAASSCGRGYFYIRIKKIRFQKFPDTCGRGLTIR